ncbi:MAG: ATP-binding protein, partial [Thiotrichaceae bacterium]|nr:ATP-binding protein [Thiotrichaceae bacterium]
MKQQMQLPPKNRFFLTRQSANLMEDLLSRLKQSGSISLLYGPRGIGKSCLLNQFVANRLTSDNSVFVQFNANNTFKEGLDGEVEFECDTFFTHQISRLKPGSTLVIDQFDDAPEEIQLNTLKHWNQVAFEKDLKLVISVEPNSLHQLTELAQRFHLKIDSVELKPLNRNEQLDFLRSTCCPTLRHIAKVPPELKQSLKLTNGLFSQLDAFKSQFGEQIICQETLLSSHKKMNKLVLYGFLVVVLLAFFAITLKNVDLTNKLPQLLDSTFQNSVKNNTGQIIKA